MSDKLVLEALQKATIAAVAASTIDTLPIKMLGRTFKPPINQQYLEFVQIPNNVVGAYYGDETIFQGIIRLILHWSNNDEGVYIPMEHLNSIAGYFTKTNTLRNSGISVKIYEKPNFSGVIEAGKELLYPVSISYRSFNP